MTAFNKFKTDKSVSNSLFFILHKRLLEKKILLTDKIQKEKHTTRVTHRHYLSSHTIKN